MIQCPTLKRGRQFGHFVKWFLKNDPEWATQVDESLVMERLEALSDLIWDALPAQWEKGFFHLKQFSEREGHAFKATDGRSASKCQGKWPDQPLDHRSGCPTRQ